MSRDSSAALLHAFAIAASLVASIIAKGQIEIPEQPIKSIGFAFFGLGALIYTYALLHLRAAFQGNVEPVTDELVTQGPYRWVRHPLYLAMLIMCLGVAIGLRSFWGLLLATILLLPTTINRARLEEQALTLRFGEAWQVYADATDFIIPFIY